MKIGSFIVLFCLLVLNVTAQDLRIDPGSHYLVLATNRTGTMQKELDSAAAQGFRVVTAMHGGDEVILLMERLTAGAAPHQYQLLATNRTSTMEKELNEAGREGFRFVPQTAFERGDEGLVVVERAPNSGKRYEYRFLATHRTSTFQKELNEAAKAGFVLRGSFSRDEKMAVMERSSDR